MNKKLFSILKYLPVICFVCYYVGNTAFIHTHTFQSYTITHSHPFIPGSHHSHSSSEEVETIALFNAAIALATPLLAIFILPILVRIVFLLYKVTASGRRVFAHLLRAPPVYNMNEA